MKEEPGVQEFLSRNLDVLSNPELGKKDFQEVKAKFGELRLLILEMIEIAHVNDHLPKGLKDQIYGYINHWNSFHRQIIEYDFDKDAAIQFRKRSELIGYIENWYQSCFTGVNPQDNRQQNNFLPVYTAIKSYTQKDFESERHQAIVALQEILEKSRAVDLMTGELRKKSAEQTVSNYALLFNEDANKYSRFNLWPPSLGAAEIWLTIGIVLVFLFGLLIVSGEINNIIKIEQGLDSMLIMVSLLTRLVLISLAVYFISFCFKQYSVNKHLATINRHRANTLNSFKLFIESIDPSDGVTKNALMLEVAKAIYEQGLTGHVNSKGADSGPSIIELTRFVNQTKQ